MRHEEAGYYVDRSGFPLLLERAVAPIRGDLHLAEVQSIYDAAHAQDTPFIAVSDLRSVTYADARFRRGVAEYNAKQEPRTRKNAVMVILVADSVIARSFITALFWLRKPVTRIEVVATPSEAADLVEQIWRERGVEPTDAMRTAVDRLRADAVPYERVRAA